MILLRETGDGKDGQQCHGGNASQAEMPVRSYPTL
jgi:hypothetical protein